MGERSWVEGVGEVVWGGGKRGVRWRVRKCFLLTFGREINPDG